MGLILLIIGVVIAVLLDRTIGLLVAVAGLLLLLLGADIRA